MARVQRSRADRSDSLSEFPGLPSTGLFTAVDKEPDITVPPPKDARKNKTFQDRDASRRPWWLPGCPPCDEFVTAVADPSKRREKGSSAIGEVVGSTRDRARGRRERCTSNGLTLRAL